MLKYIADKQPVPEELKDTIYSFIRTIPYSKTSFMANLFEIDGSSVKNTKSRFAIIFTKRQEVEAFVAEWREQTFKRAQLDKYIIAKNILLVFLKSQVRLSIFTTQICYLGHKPNYILGLKNYHKEFERKATSGNIYFAVKWLDKYKTGINLQKNPQIQGENQDKQEIAIDSLSNIPMNKQFTEFKTPEMIQYLEQMGIRLIAQLSDVDTSLKEFFKLAKITQSRISQ